MKKLFLLITCAVMALCANAQMVNPVHWTGETRGDSICLTATIDEGWHLNIIDIPADGNFDEEYAGTFSVTLPNTGEVEVRYNACDAKQCIAPETFSYTPETKEVRSEVLSRQVGSRTTEEETKEVRSPGRTTEEESESESGSSLWMVFLMGLLGGLMAIFTPCVWPIIPMTVSFFIKRNGAARGTTNASAIRDALFYGLSIILIYVGLGLLITLIFGASALNALSTNAVVNIIFFLILVVFAASFFGAFEITLPSSWSTALNAKSSKTSGFLSIMLMAFTLVIVSFSCTGPIIGTLLVEAAGKSLLAPTIGMLGFAIALALPFSLFAMFPSVLKKMPKSGGWMNTFKVTLAFLELALSLKFLSVADLAYGWHILDREVFVALWIVIFALLGLYLLGLISFPHDDDDHKKTSVTRFFLATISLSFAMYMVPGLWGAPLRAISAFAPPMSTQDWVCTGNGSAAANTLNAQHSTLNAQITFTDYDEGMAYAREHNMPVFLDFNGYGCVNCRKMEAAVLTKPEVEEHMHKYVLISLIVDDKTKLAEPIVLEENGRKVTLKTVGDKWSYMQRTEYGANAQPYYVQLNPDGSRLVESTYSYDEDIDKFLEWLKY
ncbi:MAG: protein-disulfide reductase DsbD family protein [Paludibacteraceae bacterium]